MAVVIENLWLFRMIASQNLKYDLENGLYCKTKCIKQKGYISIGSQEIISQRDRAIVKCYPDNVVNDYVPFYFSVRTPMLYNIHTGHGVPAFPQKDIIYLCCKFTDLASDNFNWCYTDGNAAKRISKFFNSIDDIEQLDWRSIRTTDFRDDNADGDEDRVRKKHSEFLVKDHIPPEFIKTIVVYNEQKKSEVDKIVEELDLDIPVKVNPKNQFYF
jgi:hypothetical protein